MYSLHWEKKYRAFLPMSFSMSVTYFYMKMWMFICSMNSPLHNKNKPPCLLHWSTTFITMYSICISTQTWRRRWREGYTFFPMKWPHFASKFSNYTCSVSVNHHIIEVQLVFCSQNELIKLSFKICLVFYIPMTSSVLNMYWNNSLSSRCISFCIQYMYKLWILLFVSVRKYSTFGGLHSI